MRCGARTQERCNSRTKARRHRSSAEAAPRNLKSHRGACGLHHPPKIHAGLLQRITIRSTTMAGREDRPDIRCRYLLRFAPLGVGVSSTPTQSIVERMGKHHTGARRALRQKLGPPRSLSSSPAPRRSRQLLGSLRLSAGIRVRMGRLAELWCNRQWNLTRDPMVML